MNRQQLLCVSSSYDVSLCVCLHPPTHMFIDYMTQRNEVLFQRDHSTNEYKLKSVKIKIITIFSLSFDLPLCKKYEKKM